MRRAAFLSTLALIALQVPSVRADGADDRYLGLMEKAVRAYSDEHQERYLADVERDGVQEHGFPRLAANLGVLVASGRLPEKRAILKRMMTAACRDAAKGKMPNPGGGNDFTVKELSIALRDLTAHKTFPPEVLAGWRDDLRRVVAERCYSIVPPIGDTEAHNWCVFGAASEQARIAMGYGGDPAFVERYVADQMRWFDENGMFRDPGEPAVYDFVTRLQFAMILRYGYDGPSRARLEELMDRSAEPTLEMLSACGEIPYGGRSNQFLHNHTFYSALCEWYARRFAERGDQMTAGRFRAAADASSAALDGWLAAWPVRHVKNLYPTDSGIGCEGYAYFDKYMVTMGSWAMMARECRADGVRPVDFAADGVFRTSPAFHWVFLRAGDYSVQFDYDANRHYDCRGLGRLHRRGAPPQICLSTPCAKAPAYAVAGTNLVDLAIMPVVGEDVKMEPAGTKGAEGRAQADWRLGDLSWHCVLTPGGLESTLTGPGEVKLSLPVFDFDGETGTAVRTDGRSVSVSYRGWTCTYAADGSVRDTGEVAENRNGRYRRFEATGMRSLKVRVTVEREVRDGRKIVWREPSAADAKSHPRLFVPGKDWAAFKAKLESTELGRLGRARLLRDAEALLALPVTERKLTGRRLLVASRVCRRVLALAMACRLTDDRRFAECAKREALAVAAFSDWNPSHFLDTAEVTLALGLAYDWLYDVLTDEERARLEQAILLKGLTKGDGRTLSDGAWVDADYNWTQVCHGGLCVGAAAIYEKSPDVCREILRRAAANLHRPMAAFAPDGGFPEGPAYWSYALEYNCLNLAIFDDFCGTDFGLSSLPGFTETCEYLDAMTGATGFLFNVSDGGETGECRRTSVLAPWYLAKRFARPDSLACHEAPAFRRYCAALSPRDEDALRKTNRFLPLVLLFLPDRDPAACAPKAPLCRTYRSEKVHVAVQRTGWGADATFAGLKGGATHVNHAHLDIGSFVFDAQGVRWAYDIGTENYHRCESLGVNIWDEERYSVFRFGAAGHGILQIGEEADLDLDAVAKVVAFEPSFPSKAVLDLSPFFRAADRALRTATMAAEGTWTLSDEIVGARKRIEWRMNTNAEISLDGRRAILSKVRPDGQPVRLVLEASGDAGVWQVRSIEHPAGKADSPNPGFRQLYFAVDPKPGEALRWDVVFSL